jgi:hypothetical protein
MAHSLSGPCASAQIGPRCATRHETMASSGPSIQKIYRPKGVQCSRCPLQPKRAPTLKTSAQIIAGALSISGLKLGKRIVHLTTVTAAFSDGDLRRSVVRQSRESVRVGRRRGGTEVLLLQSALYSKQVITRTSGRKLGVVSQLWVDSVKVRLCLYGCRCSRVTARWRSESDCRLQQVIRPPVMNCSHRLVVKVRLNGDAVVVYV